MNREDLKQADIPEYALRESPRARRISLRISPEEGLEVVVPRRYNPERVQRLLQEKKTWIIRNTKRFEEDRRRKILEQATLPEVIHLPALGETWNVRLEKGNQTGVYLCEEGHATLSIRGAIRKIPDCHHALRKWLARKAKVYLPVRLQAMARKHELSFRKTVIRGQKTLWGSCSSRGTISLNYKLLFIEPKMVDVILLHELCHTRHRNHSTRFWTLMEEKHPGIRNMERRMRKLWNEIPAWAHARS